MMANTDKARVSYKNIWVVAEVMGGKVQKVTYELLGAARALANKRKSELWCIVMGDGVSRETEALFHGGADVALTIDDPRLSRFLDEDEASALVRLIGKHKPEVVICGATTRGRALIPRVAVKSNCGLTADCTGLDIDSENGDLLQTRPAFGGNIMATIRCSNHRPQMSTVRPRVMTALKPDPSRTGRIIREKLRPTEITDLKKVIEVFHDTENAVNLADARFIISGGRGVKGPEGFKLLKTLAERVNGAVGASRAAVDSGWVPYNHQVGQTGQTVQATVYLACGISGQIQHLVGMQSCDYIIAIDKNPDTPMMQLADVAIVGDLFEVIPALVKEIPKT
ncbi:MAG: electron transfer flavoprotein subunit alpha/FixB family protein [Treponemataceae bacterium]